MKISFIFVPFLLLTISSFSNILKAETLYRTYPQGGHYGGSAYTDSEGNNYNNAPHEGKSIYGGMVNL